MRSVRPRADQGFRHSAFPSGSGPVNETSTSQTALKPPSSVIASIVACPETATARATQFSTVTTLVSELRQTTFLFVASCGSTSTSSATGTSESIVIFGSANSIPSTAT